MVSTADQKASFHPQLAGSLCTQGKRRYSSQARLSLTLCLKMPRIVCCLKPNSWQPSERCPNGTPCAPAAYTPACRNTSWALSANDVPPVRTGSSQGLAKTHFSTGCLWNATAQVKAQPHAKMRNTFMQGCSLLQEKKLGMASTLLQSCFPRRQPGTRHHSFYL